MFGSSKKTKNAKTLHFFRIILGHDQKLGLPKRFVSTYGNALSNSVLLAAPNGQVWQVELIKCGGEIWLGNGWKDFADYFSLKHGSLLVFRYEGHSRFYVLMIFDQSTFEIEYPINISSSKDANHDVDLQMPKVEDIQSDASVEIIESISQRQSLPRFSPDKRMRTTWSNGIQGTLNLKESGSTSDESTFQISRKCGSKISIPSGKEAGRCMSAAQRSRPSNEAPRNMQSLTPKRNSRTSTRASNFKSENPFFVVVMQPSYLTGCPLHIPVAFARNYFSQKQVDVILQDLDGKTWSVNCKCKVYEKNYETHFHHGWKEYALYHNLKVGDTCAFELLEGLEISLRVTIFRDAEDANDHLTASQGSKNVRVKRKRGLNTRSQSESDYTSKDEVITSWPTTKESHDPRRKIKTEHRKLKQGMQNENVRAVRRLSSKGTARAFERASKNRFNHPVFKVVITAGFLWNDYPTVSSSFCKQFIKCIPQDVTLKLKDKSWSVRLSACSDRPAKFGAGWRAFTSENKLKVGDVCIFEMITRRNIVLEVSIFRGS